MSIQSQFKMLICFVAYSQKNLQVIYLLSFSTNSLSRWRLDGVDVNGYDAQFVPLVNLLNSHSFFGCLLAHKTVKLIV